jgi:hypothetical protein
MLWKAVSLISIEGSLYDKWVGKGGPMAVGTAEAWVDEFRRVSDEDPEIQAHGKYYSCSFLLDMEEHQFQVVMHAGKVEKLLVDPGPLDERYSSRSTPARIPGASSRRRRQSRCTMGSGQHLSNGT